MNRKWNLQDIKPVQPKKKRVVSDTVEINRPPEASDQEEAEEVMSLDITDGNKKKSKSLWYALLVFLLIVGAGLIASILMGGAELTVHPKFREPNLNAVFTANKVPKPKELTYEIMTLEAEGERQVSATGQEQVTAQAEGTLLIYNKQQSDSVRLVTNTRFESPNGLIYKISDPAVIPGYTKDDAGNIVPGVTTAEVYADEVGEKYNVGPTSFKVPGFKGEPEYETIYAESVEPMTGGFDGLKFIIDDAELQTAQQALRMELRNSLLERINSEMPAGFIKFDGAVTFTYIALPSVEYGENLATIKEKALMRIPLFAESDFATFIAASSVPGYENEQVRIENPETLTFSYTSATSSGSDISGGDTLEFKLTGKPLLIWEYDEGKLKTDLLDTNKTALPNILGAYPAIEKAEAVIRPFWKTKFPTSLSEIEIIEVLDTSN